MPTSDQFPREFLGQSIENRLAYFKSKVVAHPHLKTTHQALWNAIHRPAGAALILVLGPTGVGKTTLRLRLEQQLMEEALPDLDKDRGRLPVVGVEAVAPESGNFNWKDYYTRALLALDEPLIARKTGPDSNVRGIRRDDGGRLHVSHAVAVAELRRAWEQCLAHRRPLAFIIDEAQHLKKMASGRRLLDQMDTLKSLAAMTGTVHILIGTYELLGLADLSGQLSRRSLEIHFPRYGFERAEDLLAFKSVLLTFQRHLPLSEEPDLTGRSEYFYERSVGCVGLLKDWLHRALAVALEEGQATLTATDLERQAEPTRKLLRMAREIKEGEAALLERAEGRTELCQLLGLESDPAEKNEPANTVSHSSTSRVGERRPTRDPVGAKP